MQPPEGDNTPAPAGEAGPKWTRKVLDIDAPIMASSILSECAFSSAGITITKHCNHLKADVVEALQCLKYSTRSSVLV